MLVHGGFWKWPYNRWVMWLLQRDLARRGWGSFNVEYRRLGRFGGGGGWPQTFDDVRHSIELLTSGRGPAAVDPARVVVVGHSAGGHLALVAAGRIASSGGRPPALVVSMAGPTDLERLWTNGSVPVDELTSDAPQSERWQLTSPMHALPVGVPVLCVHGDADTTVPPHNSAEFVAAAREAGDEADLVIVAGENHRDPLRPGSQIWKAVVTHVAGRHGPLTQV